jgi:hypothetical protein
MSRLSVPIGLSLACSCKILFHVCGELYLLPLRSSNLEPCCRKAEACGEFQVAVNRLSVEVNFKAEHGLETMWTRCRLFVQVDEQRSDAR